MATASVREIWGSGDPITGLVKADIGTRYHQDGTTVVWVKYGAFDYNWFPDTLDVRDGMVFKSGEVINTVVETAGVAGTGTVDASTGLAGRPGIWTGGVTSTATPDRSRMFWSGGGVNPNNNLVPGGGRMLWRGSAMMPVLSDAVNRMSFRLGFFNQTAAGDATNGMYFECDLAVNGNGNWWAVTADNSVYTRQDTLIAPAAGVFNRLGIDCDAAGALCWFMINDRREVFNVANIPSAGRGTGVNAQVIKTLGVAGVLTAKVDYSHYAMICAAGR